MGGCGILLLLLYRASQEAQMELPAYEEPSGPFATGPMRAV